MDILKDHILSGAQALDDAEGFSIDRAKYLNASTADGCIRKQWYERKHGVPEQDWGFARRGKQGELYLVDCLAAAGIETAYMGDEQVSLASEEHRISATPDGFMWDGNIWIEVEFKTIDPRTNRARLPKASHVTQIQIGMELAHRQGGAYPAPDHGVIVYMDASNYNDITEVKVDRDPGILDRLAPRAKAMLDSRKADKLDREGKRTGECKLYGGCPFAAECGIGIEGDAKVSRGNRGSSLDEAVQAYTIAVADMDDASNRKADAAESIKAGLAERNARELVVGNHLLKLTEVAGRVTVDWKKMEAAGYDISAFKKIGLPSERLTVK